MRFFYLKRYKNWPFSTTETQEGIFAFLTVLAKLIWTMLFRSKYITFVKYQLIKIAYLKLY